MYNLVRAPIDIPATISGLAGPEDGAVAIFLGTVRGRTSGRKVLRLEYQAYESMALDKLREVGAQAKARFPITDICITHRLGVLEITECSVVIAVSAPHREAAFDACRFAIDTIKKIVPIWKKEVYEDGEAWIEGS